MTNKLELKQNTAPTTSSFRRSSAIGSMDRYGSGTRTHKGPRVQVLKSSFNASSDNRSSDENGTSNTTKALERCRPSYSRTLVLRLLFVLSLFCAVLICSYVSYNEMIQLELEVGRQTYESVAASALRGAKEMTMRKFQGARVMETVLSYAFPDAKMWPLVALDGFFHIGGAVVDLASSGPIGLAVFVNPDNATAFETQARQHYARQGYPTEAGLSDFGFGIWTVSNKSSYADGRVPARTGKAVSYESNNTILVPLMDHTMWNTSALMYDIHTTDKSVDAIIECSRRSVATSGAIARSKGPAAPTKPRCTVSTGFKKLISRTDLATLIDEPIYPANDPTTLVGYIGTSIQWVDVLKNVVPDYISGIVAVISTDSLLYSNTGFDTASFLIQKGVPVVLGEGDLHDPAFTQYGRSIVLNDIETDATSVKHKLTLYPTSFEHFRTQSPMIIALGFAAVIAVCTAIFFAYDFLMQRDIYERKVILEMKRRFVRFISHEIRTPLNTVCMGLELLESELLSYHDKTNQGKDATIARGDPDTEREAGYWYEITRDIQENAASAVGILNELLKYDKIETGNLELEIDKVLVWDLATKVVNQFKLQAVNRGIEMTFAYKADEMEHDVETGENLCPDALRHLVVYGDDMRLQEVVRNLISNSLKFTPTGGKLKVEVQHVSNGLPCKKGRWTETKRSRRARRERQQVTEHSIHSLASYYNFPRAGSIVLSVSDTGVGMTEQQLSRVFEEGVQFNANRLQAGGGSGLGLCISKSIIERHYGVISAASPGEQKGCTFSVELPLYDASQDQIHECFMEGLVSGSLSEVTSVNEVYSSHLFESGDPDPTATKSEEFSIGVSQLVAPMQTSSQSTSMITRPVPEEVYPSQVIAPTASLQERHHVLVVDDVLSNRKMLVRLLERAGHSCVSSGNGQEAIDEVLANQRAVSQGEMSEKDGAALLLIDCILMDYEMPVLNGPDATARLRLLGYNGTILGVTGNVLREDVSYFITKGADDVLPKPVSMTLLNNYWQRKSSPQPREDGGKVACNHGPSPPAGTGDGEGETEKANLFPAVAA